MNDGSRAMRSHAPTLGRRVVPIDLPTWALLIVGALGVLAAVIAGWLVAVLAGSDQTSSAAVLAAVGALVSALVAVGAIAALHAGPFGREVSLLRASSPTHPLLKRLFTEAPGTYVHSLSTANLSEAAADALGADALLARVGAYYHDIGKLSQPCFFFENQEDGENPHDDAPPYDSASLIMSHVTEGYDLGRAYHLPPPVLDIIRQHHGTSLVRYFFHRAAQADASVFEADFRYPGEPPRSKEAAIVMLADASEASVRAMSRPDAAQIGVKVSAAIEERTRDGQLVNSGLTDAELEVIRGVFVRQLVGLRHVRCAYPNHVHDTEGARDADQRPQPSGT